MKTMWMSVGAIAAVGLLVGCETIPPGAERGPHGTIAYNVLIEASEPGTLIRANGQDVGNTPVTLKIYGDTDGTFHDFGSYYYVIQAFPPTTNLFAQTRVFRTGHMFTPEDVIPRQINFDMTKPAPAEAPASMGPNYYSYPGYYYGPGIYFGPPGFYGPGPGLGPGPRPGPGPGFHGHW